MSPFNKVHLHLVHGKATYARTATSAWGSCNRVGQKNRRMAVESELEQRLLVDKRRSQDEDDLDHMLSLSERDADMLLAVEIEDEPPSEDDDVDEVVLAANEGEPGVDEVRDPLAVFNADRGLAAEDCFQWMHTFPLDGQAGGHSFATWPAPDEGGCARNSDRDVLVVAPFTGRPKALEWSPHSGFEGEAIVLSDVKDDVEVAIMDAFCKRGPFHYVLAVVTVRLSPSTLPLPFPDEKRDMRLHVFVDQREARKDVKFCGKTCRASIELQEVPSLIHHLDVPLRFPGTVGYAERVFLVAGGLAGSKRVNMLVERPQTRHWSFASAEYTAEHFPELDYEPLSAITSLDSRYLDRGKARRVLVTGDEDGLLRVTLSTICLRTGEVQVVFASHHRMSHVGQSGRIHEAKLFWLRPADAAQTPLQLAQNRK